ncbi:Clp protease N-terminal domain-containing protein [Streptomyces sp. NPDC088258]|uniref:Clp protease N-terminal domain-containing protein n=1 Tax=Streptomyces sp. NPDC088258 TaxID=3365849 RepID=UPI0037F7C41D
MKQQSPTVTTTEFAADAVELLARTIRYSMRFDGGTTGTEHLLATLLDDNEKPGAALVPGMRNSAAVSGQIRGRDDRHWVHDDAFHGEPVAADAPGEADNRFEAGAAWREALWLAARKYARKLPDGAVWPARPSGALRESLVGAVRLTRAEGTYEVRERHLARALLNVGACRAVEAMAMRRVDPAAAASALDARAEAVRDGAEPWWSEAEAESGSVKLLRTSGLLGERGTWWMRGMMSLMSRSAGDGDPVLLVLSHEARRQAARHGRSAAEQEDLLLAIPALDRALTLAGATSSGTPRSIGSVAELLRSHGMDDALVTRAADSAGQSAGSVPEDDAAIAADADAALAADADRTLAKARLLCAERGAGPVGAEHLLAALLDDADGRAVRLLQDNGVDLTGVRDGLDLLLGA